MLNRPSRRRHPSIEEVTPPEPDLEAYPEPAAVEALEAEDFPAEVEPPRRARERWAVRWRVLLVILLLVAAGALALTGFPGQLPADVVAQWPWLLIVLGGLGLLLGIVTAWPQGTLGGPPVLAVGLVALLDRQIVASWPMTLAGAILLALGAAAILRGITMRAQE